MNTDASISITVNSSLEIDNCSYKGNMNGYSCAGMCGSGSFFSSDCGPTTNCIANVSLNIKNCKSSGQINNQYCGGILGNDCNGYTHNGNFSNNSTLTISKCTSNCDITPNAIDSGGIIGANFSLQSPNLSIYGLIERCSSTGMLQAYGCGGIVGDNCGNFIINNCYTTGTIYNNSNGLVGYNNISTIPQSSVSNSYASGTVLQGGFGVAGGGQANLTVTNCYAQNQYSGVGALTGVSNIALIRGHRGSLQRNIWKKVKHSYPILY